MPRAGHDAAFDEAVAERAAAMQAHVVEGKEFVAEAEQRDVPSRDDHHAARAGREITDAPDANKLTSQCYLSSLNPAGMATDAASTAVVSFSISTDVVMMTERCAGLSLF